MSAEPVRTSGGDSTPSAPFALLLYGEEYANLGLADELALDGYEVRRASDPAMLRAACDTEEIEVVIFGQPTRRGSGLDVLRQLRAGALAPEVKPMLRTLWMSPNGDLGDVLRGFEAGADDVLRTPFAYPEFRGVNFNSRGSPDFNSWSGIWGLRLPANLGSRPVARPRKSQQRRANESRIRRIIPLGSRAPILHFSCARDQRSLITRRLSVIAALRPGRVVLRPSAAAWSSASCA